MGGVLKLESRTIMLSSERDLVLPMRHGEALVEKIEENFKYWRKNGHMIVSGKMANGWSELYLVKGGKGLETEEDIFTVKEDATKGQIRSAFRKFSKGKLENRMMLSKFVDMVAA